MNRQVDPAFVSPPSHWPTGVQVLFLGFWRPPGCVLCPFSVRMASLLSVTHAVSPVPALSPMSHPQAALTTTDLGC